MFQVLETSFRLRRNQSGLSLIEVLVSLGILGVVTAALTASITSMMVAQKTIEARQNISSLVTEVQALVSNGSTCLNLFGGGTQVFDYSLARSTTGDPVQLSMNGDVLSNDVTNIKYGLTISRLYLTNGTLAGLDTSARSVYKAQLVGEFRPTGNLVRIGGLSDFRPRIMTNGFFTVNSVNQIVGCADQSPVEQSLAAELCTGFGGVYNAGTRKCDRLIAASDVCQITGQTFNSSTGQCDPVLAASTPSPAQICTSLGGSFSRNACQLPSSGSSGSGGGSNFRWVATHWPSLCPSNVQFSSHGCQPLGSRCTTQGQTCTIGIAFGGPCRQTCD